MAADLADRLGAAPTASSRSSPYGQRWVPADESSAMDAIYNTTDEVGFREAGRADAERLLQFVGGGSTVLDLGCGIGRIAQHLAPHVHTLYAADVSQQMLDFARKRMKGVPNVRFVRSHGTSVPDVPGQVVDLAYSILVLQHLEREDAFLMLRDLRRVLRPDGTLFVTFPNLLSPDYAAAFVNYAESAEISNIARARIYTPEEARAVVELAGFDIERLAPEAEISVVARPRKSPEG